jgi:hypothetical protein
LHQDLAQRLSSKPLRALLLPGGVEVFYVLDFVGGFLDPPVAE